LKEGEDIGDGGEGELVSCIRLRFTVSVVSVGGSEERSKG